MRVLCFVTLKAHLQFIQKFLIFSLILQHQSCHPHLMSIQMRLLQNIKIFQFIITAHVTIIKIITTGTTGVDSGKQHPDAQQSR